MIQVKISSSIKNYQIIIKEGIKNTAGSLISSIWSSRKVGIVSDENVATLYLDDLSKQLNALGFEIKPLVVPAGENSKSLTQVADLIKQMAQVGFTRDDGLIALGGGMIGDLTGLTANLYMRGIAYLQIPTSLTAQVDSSVGGKTAVNLAGIKNILGTFYQPDLVIVDPIYLRTLSNRDLVEGYGEVVKTSALAGADFFDLTGSIQNVAAIRQNALTLIEKAITYKAQIIMADEKEAGNRKFLNFGHTFGHPIEALNQGQMRHGEAVSIGMVTLTRIFEKAKISPAGLTQELIQRLKTVGLPISSNLIGSPEFISLLKNDKKNRHGILNLVVLKAVGHPIIVLEPLNQVEDLLKGVVHELHYCR